MIETSTAPAKKPAAQKKPSVTKKKHKPLKEMKEKPRKEWWPGKPGRRPIWVIKEQAEIAAKARIIEKANNVHLRSQSVRIAKI